jgi:hypothetical protein
VAAAAVECIRAGDEQIAKLLALVCLIKTATGKPSNAASG